MTEQASSECEFAALIGVDWGDREHAWTMQVCGSERRERGKLAQTPEAIEAWAMELAARFPGRPVAIAVEQSRGALVYALTRYAHLRLFPVHPSTSHNYRAAMFPSGCKDDPKDADLQLDLLVNHRQRLRMLRPDTVETRRLQGLVEKRRQLVDERTAQTNRITDLLKHYFPQALGWFDELFSPLAIAFLRRWPTLRQVQQEGEETVRAFFARHRCRKERTELRVQQIGRARPATEDAAVIEPHSLMVRTLLGVLEALQEGIAALDRTIAEAAAGHADYPIFASFPGAGPVMAPRLLAAFGSQRERYGSAQQMQAFSGIAPVISRSGTSQKWIHFRWACPKFLRQTFHEYAALSISHCAWARSFYRQQRQEKHKGHHAAVRALAFKWIRIQFRCWQSRTPYDDAVFLKTRGHRSEPAASPASAPPPGSTSHPECCGAHGKALSFQFKSVGGMSKLIAVTT